MSFNPAEMRSVSVAGQGSGCGSGTLWHYRTADSIAFVTSADYFASFAQNFSKGDEIRVSQFTDINTPDELLINFARLTVTLSSPASVVVQIVSQTPVTGAPDQEVPLPIVVVPTNLPTNLVSGRPFTSWGFTATGGSGTKTYTLTSGAFPSAMTLRSDGVILGGTLSYDDYGDYEFTVSADDPSAAAPGTYSGTLNVAAKAVTITFITTPPTAVVGETYPEFVIGVFGGPPGSVHSLEIESGALPPDLILEASTAVGAGGTYYQVSGDCSAGFGQTFSPILLAKALGTAMEARRQLNISVQAVGTPDLVATQPALTNFTVGVEYTKAWSISGGTGTKTVTRVGQVPPGFDAADTTNVFHGTATSDPNNGAPYTGEHIVRDSGTPPQEVRVPYSLAAAATGSVSISTVSLTAPVVGSSYSKAFTASGGSGACTWTIEPGSTILPPGMTLAFSGTNDTVCTFTATAIDAAASGRQYSGSVRCTRVTGGFAVAPWAFNVAAVGTPFDPPVATGTTPTSFDVYSDTSEANTFDVAALFDENDAAGDVTYGFEWETAPPNGFIGAMLDADSYSIDFTKELGSNPSGDTPYRYRIYGDYTEPSSGGGGGGGGSGGGGSSSLPPLTEREADFTARKALSGVIQTQDFSLTTFPTLASLLSPAVGQTSQPPGSQLSLDQESFITGGQSFKITSLENSQASHGYYLRGYPFYNSTDYKFRPFYVQVVMKMDEAALGWVAQADQTNSQKIFYLKNNSSGGGQTYFVAGSAMGGFVRWNFTNNAALWSFRTGSVGGRMRFYQNNLAKTPASTSVADWLRAYGICQDFIGLGITHGTELSSAHSGELLTRRTGYPNPDVMQAGGFLIEPDRWFVVTTYIDPAPPDIFVPSTSSIIGSIALPPSSAGFNNTEITAQTGRIARVVGWASHYGEPAKCLADSFDADRRDGVHYTPAPAVGAGSGAALYDSNGNWLNKDSGYSDWRCQVYNTGIVTEPGRPPRGYSYAQVIVSHSPIPHPHHLNTPLPTPRAGAVTHYGAIR